VAGLPHDHPAHRLADSPYLRACRGAKADRVPVWFQRQAGRSLPEYRAVRAEGSILQSVARPELATEITLQPVRRYGVDAAILFSDIVVPAVATGFGMDVVAGVGPVAAEPVRSSADVRRLRPLVAADDVPHVIQTVEALAAELEVPLIAFAGAPFTLASYLVEGRPSRTQARTKSLMLSEPDVWHELCQTLVQWATEFLRSQVMSGASSIQLFDSWVGTLSPDHYRTYVMPHTRAVFDGVADLGVPRGHFGLASGELLPMFAEAGATVVGVDWRVPLDRARRRLPARVAVQGNLDPAACLAPWPRVQSEVRAVLAANAGRAGHVFNLGHGVLPGTDPAILEQVVDLVHREGRVRRDP